ncbi:MAG: hypothetical protein CMD26_03390 [Flavobacteriales bacterium]|nr:hypothetical protein [Flavobacteriales bacterium]
MEKKINRDFNTLSKFILPSSYFPPIGYFKILQNQQNLLIENFEYFKRHSIRNRTSILGVNGIILMTVPIQRKNYSKNPINSIKIANNDWKKNHLNSIKSAYGSSPFFIYYYEEIEKIINKDYVFLIDLNNEILEYFLNELKITSNIKQTTEYTKSYPSETLDYRINDFPVSSHNYQQVFAKNFIPNLSILDLIFNLGPNSPEGIQ